MVVGALSHVSVEICGVAAYLDVALRILDDFHEREDFIAQSYHQLLEGASSHVLDDRKSGA
jgi:hypothetical protein